MTITRRGGATRPDEWYRRIERESDHGHGRRTILIPGPDG
jgi:hypothetical protein